MKTRECPRCLKIVRLTKDGKIYKHKDNGHECFGSKKYPNELTPNLLRNRPFYLYFR